MTKNDDIKKPPIKQLSAATNKLKNGSTDLLTILRRSEQVSGDSTLTARWLNPQKRAISTEESFDAPIRREKPQKKFSNEKKARKIRSANMRRIAKLKSRFANIENPCPKLIPTEIWRNCKVIVSDATGRTIEEFSKQISNKIALSRIHRAALAIDDQGKAVFCYRGDNPGSLRARRIFALGYLCLAVAKSTRRKGQYKYLVAGIPQSAMISALESPNSKRQRIHPRTFTGIHAYTSTPGQIGYLDALKKSGFCYSRQAKWKTGTALIAKGWKDIRSQEIAGNRGEWSFSLARYWIVTDQYTDCKVATERQALWSDWTAGYQPTDTWYSLTVNGKTSDFYPVLKNAKPPN